MSEVVYVVVKNKWAKELNRQPWLEVRAYKVERMTKKAIVLKCGKTYPKERCFNTEEEAKASANGFLEKRLFGDTYEPKFKDGIWL